jgi:hypothetical protein
MTDAIDSDGPSSEPTPSTPEEWDVHGTPDATLGGYLREHERPPAFDGSDGAPYTVSMETERTPDLRNPIEGFLVFPRWADTGIGVVGHVETPTLFRGRKKEEVLRQLGDLPLLQVKQLLDEALRDAAKPQDP